MKHERTPRADEDHGFEPEERPTRPAPPRPEHLRALRSASDPPRAKVAARRRPALTPATQSWLATKARVKPPTATSRWRAMAATVLGGGSGRQSHVDPAEVAPPVPDAPAVAEPPPTPPAGVPSISSVQKDDVGPGGTLRMPERRSPPSMNAREPVDDAPAGEDAGPERHAFGRRWIFVSAAGLLCVIGAWAMLRGGRASPLPPASLPPSPPAAVDTAMTAASLAAVDLPAPSTPAPPATETASSPATAPPASAGSPLVHPSLRHGAPRRLAPHASSNVF